jgi:hypothetical protein
MPATAADVQRLIGDLDPMIVARVLATNASVDEISEALRSVDAELSFGELPPHEPSSPRAAEVRAILDENSVFEDDFLFDEYDPTADF